MPSISKTSFRSILLSIVAVVFISMFPLRASALAVPVMVVADIPFTAKEVGLDVAVKVAASAMMDTLVGSVTDWIVTGFDGGNPSFVINPRDLLSRVQQNAGGVFQLQLANSNICEPFRVSVNRRIAQSATEVDEETQDSPNVVTRATECHLDQVVRSGVIENYFTDEGFVTEGGYAPLLQAFGRVADDPTTAQEVAESLQKARQAKAAFEAIKEVDRGAGFESLKECVDGNVGSCLRFEVKTPGKTIGAALEKSINQSLDDIANADEISELIVGIIQGLTTQALSNAGLR